jgi:hypothetical protein
MTNIQMTCPSLLRSQRRSFQFAWASRITASFPAPKANQRPSGEKVSPPLNQADKHQDVVKKLTELLPNFDKEIESNPRPPGKAGD